MTGLAFRKGRGAGLRAARRPGSPCATTPPSRTASTCTGTISTSSGKTAPSATTGTRPWVEPRQSRDVLCVFDNPGKWLLHCHTLGHQASGMKTWVEVA